MSLRRRIRHVGVPGLNTVKEFRYNPLAACSRRNAQIAPQLICRPLHEVECCRQVSFYYKRVFDGTRFVFDDVEEQKTLAALNAVPESGLSALLMWGAMSEMHCTVSASWSRRDVSADSAMAAWIAAASNRFRLESGLSLLAHSLER